jgi:hypothetical protein
LVELIAGMQEGKAIACSLLHFLNPDEARRMGQPPALIAQSKTIPSLATLRDSAHQFSHLLFPKDNGIWRQPEVQQAIRYTNLWPWARKSFMSEDMSDKLRSAHKNTADRAAVSYFINNLSHRSDAENTLYVLVTHDGPLISDFVKFITGVEKSEIRVKGEGRKKQIFWNSVDKEQYEERGLAIPDKLAHSAILTGKELVEFIHREQVRIQKHCHTTHELTQAMERLTDAVDLLELKVKKDIQAHGLTEGGTFAKRIRDTAAHSKHIGESR